MVVIFAIVSGRGYTRQSNFDRHVNQNLQGVEGIGTGSVPENGAKKIFLQIIRENILTISLNDYK